MAIHNEHLQDLLQHWNLQSNLSDSPNQGLINQTYLVGNPPQGVLQWVNPIFNPKVHYDIQALTQHLRRKGFATTELIPTKNGHAYIEAENGGYWRMLRYIKGVTHDEVHSPKLAHEAGKLVGRFHQMLQDFDHTWQAPFRDAHNTQNRMNGLTAALQEVPTHPLRDEAERLGHAILETWQKWNGPLDLPTRACHGDLKISNLHFNPDDTGLCLLDLDTIGPADYSVEMGDAWRSWCNPAGESNLNETHFSLELFEAAAEGWLSHVGPISPAEKESLVSGVERICIELSARFCADALYNKYFKEDLQTFPEIGSHNLYRAKVQFKLAQSVGQQRLEAEKIIRKF